MKLEIKMRNKNKNNAFTIIELLVAIAVLGGLVTIVIINSPASTQKARDVQRQTDLKNYQNALELYAMKHGGLYPTSGYQSITNICTALGMTSNQCKNDPKSGNYYYETDSSGTKYTTWSNMERTANTYVTCSDGKNGMASVTPAAGVCPTFIYTTPSVVPPSSTPIPTNTPTPTPIIVLNSASGLTCNQKCQLVNPLTHCTSVGTDSMASNNVAIKYTTFCIMFSGSCTTQMTSLSGICSGKQSMWTNCKCIQ